MIQIKTFEEFINEKNNLITESFTLGKDFGFGENLDKENDGKNTLYLTEEMGDKVLTKYSEKGAYFKDKKITTSYTLQGSNIIYKMDYTLRLLTFSESKTKMWAVLGRSGSHGFKGGEFTVREKLSAKVVKESYAQLIKLLEKL